MEKLSEKQKNSIYTNGKEVGIDKVGIFINKPENVSIYVSANKDPYPNYLAFKWDDDLGKAYGELSYKKQFFKMKIREKELEDLYSFLKSNENFKISAITGAAGSGKSGLVYNFCKAVEKEHKWSIYGVTYEALEDSANDDLLIRTEGIKDENILLVVDYVLVNAEKIGNWIRRLRRKCKDKTNLKVRILLIERANVEKEKKPYWYVKLIEKNKLDDICNFADFIKLERLSDEVLEDIFVSYVKEREGENDDGECVGAAYEIMGQIEENAKTPLFVKCIADAWMEDKNCRKKRWGREEILSYMVEKEDERIRHVLSTSTEAEDLMKILVFTMALSGISIGSNLPEYLKKGFDDLQKEFGSGKPNLSHLFIEFGKVDEKNMCLKLSYPDILQEFFCLEYLKRIYSDAFRPDFVNEFIEQVWKTDPKTFASFLYKLIEDFPDHEMVSGLEILQKPSNIEAETRVIYADVLREYTYWKQEEDKAFDEVIEIFRQLIQEAKCDQERNEIYEKFAVALFNMTVVWAGKEIDGLEECKYLEIMQDEIGPQYKDAYIEYIFANTFEIVKKVRDKKLAKELLCNSSFAVKSL